MDGKNFTYDAIGNPTNYYNGTWWSFGWQNGRQLTSASSGTNNISYTYDADGLRTGKTVNGTEYTYHYAGGKLMRETYGTITLDFFYDAGGYPFAIKYNGTVFYYITNLQGDVMAIVNANGNVLAQYEYDPYGNIVSQSGPFADINPLRYRGYVYDTETRFYYLQSRYYDPELGRFINADSYTATGNEPLDCNMFAYCKNNPVMNSDPTGELGILFWSFVAVVVVSAGANALSTWIAGGSPEDCFNAAIAGGIGGAAGFGMAMLLGFTPQGNIVGRATATLVSDLTTARLNNGELTASDYMYAGVDVVMDACYSTIGYYYTAPIKSVFGQNAVNAVFDACIDNAETYLFYSNTTPTQQTPVQQRGDYGGTGGDFRYAAYIY